MDKFAPQIIDDAAVKNHFDTAGAFGERYQAIIGQTHYIEILAFTSGQSFYLATIKKFDEGVYDPAEAQEAPGETISYELPWDESVIKEFIGAAVVAFFAHDEP